MDDAIIEKAKYLLNLDSKSNSEYMKFWFSNLFLSWRWWLCLILIVTSWALWLKFRNKESTSRLLFAALCVMIIAELLDVCGVESGLWSYNIDIDPFTPSFITFDLSLLPVATMAFLQYKPKFNPILKAIIYSAFCCFIFQPVFVWLGIYNRLQWKDYYSFPVLIIIYLIAYYCSTRENFKKL